MSKENKTSISEKSKVSKIHDMRIVTRFVPNCIDDLKNDKDEMMILKSVLVTQAFYFSGIMLHEFFCSYTFAKFLCFLKK